MGIQYLTVSAAEKGHLNQDVAVVHSADGSLVAVVADGHGSPHVDAAEAASLAQFVAECTAEVMAGPETEISSGFNETAQQLVVCRFHPDVGAVVGGVHVSLALGRILIAHVGDVRLYANIRRQRNSWERGRTGFRMFTRDHTANNPSEDERLRPFIRNRTFEVRPESPFGLGWDSGGALRLHFVENGKCSRPNLGPTRGFGDVPFQPAYTHVPDLTTVLLTDELRHAVFALCSDGARRNVGRTFHHFERVGVPDSLEPFGETFLAFHEGRVRGVSSDGDDDATAVFFRVT